MSACVHACTCTHAQVWPRSPFFKKSFWMSTANGRNSAASRSTYLLVLTQRSLRLAAPLPSIRHIRLDLSRPVHDRACAFVRVCMSSRVHACVCVCVCACVHVYVCARTHTCTPSEVANGLGEIALPRKRRGMPHIRVYTNIHTHMCTHTYAHRRTRIRTIAHTRTHACVHARTHACTRT